MLPVTSQRKTFRLLAAVVLLAFMAGCSGINTEQRVSPATFFMPGLLKADPPAAANDVVQPQTTPARQVALAR